MEQRDHRDESETPGAQTPWHFPECKGDVEDNGCCGNSERPERALFQRCANSGTDGRELPLGNVAQCFFKVSDQFEVLFIAQIPHAYKSSAVFCERNGEISQRVLRFKRTDSFSDFFFLLFLRHRDFHQGSTRKINA